MWNFKINLSGIQINISRMCYDTVIINTITHSTIRTFSG